jgi:hypothetical protein
MVAKVESDVLTRMLRPDEPNLAQDLARFVLGVEFSEAEHARMEELGHKCNEGTLSPAERAEYEYLVILGQFVTLMHLKARRSLQVGAA